MKTFSPAPYSLFLIWLRIRLSITINLCPLIRDPDPIVPFWMPVSIMISHTGLGYCCMDAYMYLSLIKCWQRTRWKVRLEDESQRTGMRMRLLMQGAAVSVANVPVQKPCAARTERLCAGSSLLQGGVVPAGLLKGGPSVQRHQR